MAVFIDKLAVVHPNAKIGENCTIGPFCTVGPNAQIGDRTRLQSHVVVDGNTEIGADCQFFPFASIGTQSQDLKYEEKNQTFTKIGYSNIFREYVTVHSGTDDQTSTEIGNHCAFLALSHVGHNSVVGNHVIMSHNATLGGHVTLGNYANIGGLSAIHQFVKVGDYAMVAGMARVVQDILPYTLCEGAPAHMRIINKVLMDRTGHSLEEIKTAKNAFKILFKNHLKLDDAVAKLKTEFPDSAVAKMMLDFIQDSERGLARPTK